MRQLNGDPRSNFIWLSVRRQPALAPGTDGRSADIELAFLGHPLERFGRALDPVLTVVAIGRQQPDHLIGAAGSRTRDIAGSKIDGLTHAKLVLQRPLHHSEMPAEPTVPIAAAD